MSVLVRLAALKDVPDIVRVCTAGQWDTYGDIYSPEYIRGVIAKYYTPERIASEIGPSDSGQGWQWDGWLVATLGGEVIGASGGGPTGADTWEIFVLYLDPIQRRKGAGRALLEAMTAQALEHGASEQWVSVTQENEKGLPFYRAMGFEVREAKESLSESTGEALRNFRMARSLEAV